jgi:hypothetical protein
VKIAFLHYHLRPGGVTTVLRHQIQALKNDAALLVISGEPPPANFPCDVACIPGVGYAGRGDLSQGADQIADQVIDRIRRHFDGACDLLHIHNPLLAKNRLLPEIINSLQQSGLKLFLQVHDFAEDGRPGAFFKQAPYPQNCHYGVINLRDYHILANAGLQPDGLHYIPNCVLPFDDASDAPTGSYGLYPVRAIRRKNIGEALLLSLFLPGNDAIYITQPPNSAMDFPGYNHWRSYVARHTLPVHFEMGKHHNFHDLVSSAKWFLTTSITEGFGFAFLEPWTAGKHLIGRHLPEICKDFSSHGIRLGHLYNGILIPKDWIGRQRLHDRFRSCLEANQGKYETLWPDNWMAACLNRLEQEETIDFGMLDEDFQTVIIDMIRQYPAQRRALLQRNPSLYQLFYKGNTAELISLNRERVLSHYHLGRYRERLLGTYARILKKPVQQTIDRKVLLAGFLNFHNFSLLKWGPFHA